MTYTYTGNRLQSIAEAGQNTAVAGVDQFLSGVGTYGYDASGNITSDPNKGADYTYNHLNKPDSADLESGNIIHWIYSEDGTKLMEHYSGDSSATHDAFFYIYDALLHVAHVCPVTAYQVS